MAARKKARPTHRRPAIASSLEKSAKAIDQAVALDKKARFSGIGAAIIALREFCRNWPKVKPILKRVIAALKKNGEHRLAEILEALVSFLDTVAKICPLLPR